ncbi:hypothetical protein AVEN_217347-1, partial [Araneus ventricosus]
MGVAHVKYDAVPDSLWRGAKVWRGSETPQASSSDWGSKLRGSAKSNPRVASKRSVKYAG